MTIEHRKRRSMTVDDVRHELAAIEARVDVAEFERTRRECSGPLLGTADYEDWSVLRAALAYAESLR